MATAQLIDRRGKALKAEKRFHSTAVSRLIQALTQCPRYFKRSILLALDLSVLLVALWSALYLRHSTIYNPATPRELLLLLAGPGIAVATFGWFGIYRIVTRYFSTSSTTLLIAYFWLSVLIWSVVVFMAGQQGIARTVMIGFGFMGTFAIVAVRRAVALTLALGDIQLPARALYRKPVLIYGAGEFGLRIAAALKNSGEFEPVGFVDNARTLSGQYVGGLMVFHPDKIGRAKERFNVKVVVLAIPESQRRERRRVVDQLRLHHVEIKTLPLIEDIAAGHVRVTNIQPIAVDDLLGRDPVPPLPELLRGSVFGKSILVTGAGGSIGAELVRQLCRHEPRRVVLMDSAEPALYAIEQDLRASLDVSHTGDHAPDIVVVLGSTLDETLLREILHANNVETIYHAAAYKHVPIVETNAIVALKNNIFGTLMVAKTAIDAEVERVVLISTDKAVRPVGVMGSSKRISELVFQAYAAQPSKTVFTMVRFGNVLDSSGSVVHRFRRQIASGGPLTVTHPDVTRYFMSVHEAAELVIQAGSMAQGGDVFVLDMGEPIMIRELAQLMIKLAGLEIRDADNPDGDVAIEYIGLRPGEKLSEELLIGTAAVTTDHPRILRCNEPSIALADLMAALKALSTAIELRDKENVRIIMQALVEGSCGDRS